MVHYTVHTNLEYNIVSHWLIDWLIVSESENGADTDEQYGRVNKLHREQAAWDAEQFWAA